MRKRILSGALTLAMLLMTAFLPVWAAETPSQENQGEEISEYWPDETEDVQDEPEMAKPVLKQEHISYMRGFPNGSFQPNAKLTRAQAAQIVYGLLAQPEDGARPCSYADVADGAWYAQAVRALCRLGILDDADVFAPESVITRAEFVRLLCQIKPLKEGEAVFSDVTEDHWAAPYINAAASAGWIGGYPDGSFRPAEGLSRAEACVVINQMLGRMGDDTQAEKLLGLGLFSDVSENHWAAWAVAEAAIAHTPVTIEQKETWSEIDFSRMTFKPGIHSVKGGLYYVDRYGKLAVDKAVGAYTADGTGALHQQTEAYRMPKVPYISQIDNIYAWVGCEAVATLMGLKAKGYATDVPVKRFLDRLPQTTSNPEKGFVGSVYVPDPTKKTRTTIYPARLAQYSNTYCHGETPCADFRGASIIDLKRELLAGNCVVGYMTLWWETPYYRNYRIEGSIQRLVSNNHAVLVCGYDSNRGYFISDPYNYYNRGEVYQYWENAQTFEKIWNERKVGMIIR